MSLTPSTSPAYEVRRRPSTNLPPEFFPKNLTWGVDIPEDSSPDIREINYARALEIALRLEDRIGVASALAIAACIADQDFAQLDELVSFQNLRYHPNGSISLVYTLGSDYSAPDEVFLPTEQIRAYHIPNHVQSPLSRNYDMSGDPHDALLLMAASAPDLSITVPHTGIPQYFKIAQKDKCLARIPLTDQEKTLIAEMDAFIVNLEQSLLEGVPGQIRDAINKLLQEARPLMKGIEFTHRLLASGIIDTANVDRFRYHIPLSNPTIFQLADFATRMAQLKNMLPSGTDFSDIWRDLLQGKTSVDEAVLKLTSGEKALSQLKALRVEAIAFLLRKRVRDGVVAGNLSAELRDKMERTRETLPNSVNPTSDEQTS